MKVKTLVRQRWPGSSVNRPHPATIPLDIDFSKMKIKEPEIVCECGKDTAGDGGKHSDYCPKYGLEECKEKVSLGEGI